MVFNERIYCIAEEREKRVVFKVVRCCQQISASQGGELLISKVCKGKKDLRVIWSLRDESIQVIDCSYVLIRFIVQLP